jgi:hypothetical protein
MKGSVFVDLTGRRRKIMFAAGATVAALAIGYIVALVIGLLGGPQAPGVPFGTHDKRGQPAPRTGEAGPGAPLTGGDGSGSAAGTPDAPSGGPAVLRDAPRRSGATAIPGTTGTGSAAPSSRASSTTTPAPATSSTPPATPTPTPTPTPSAAASAEGSSG